MKQERIRVDIWASLRPIIDAEIARSGLSAQEVINIALIDYFGLSPLGTKRVDTVEIKSIDTCAETTKSSEESEDYI